MAARASWHGRTVLDLGCGSGFHLPRFAEDAATVVGVDPHPGLVRLAQRRTRDLPTVDVRPGTAQQIPLPDASIDVVHVRWAYFFGPGCEPGLAELDRVVRRGGTALVIDNDGSRSTFGSWFRRGYPHLPAPAEIERFWAQRGWTPHDGRHGLAVREPRRPGGRRTDRVQARGGRRDPARPRGRRGRLRREPLVQELRRRALSPPTRTRPLRRRACRARTARPGTCCTGPRALSRRRCPGRPAP